MDNPLIPAPLPLHVVAAVIRDPVGSILISYRPAHVDQGGLWEFPGGKLLPGEDRLAGLKRELYEELGIEITQALPLLKIAHRYPSGAVLLDIFEVEQWRGKARGREGQAVRWVSETDLYDFDFPVANASVVIAARLPRVCLITPEPVGARERFLDGLCHALQRGIRLVQLRAPALSPPDYRNLSKQMLVLCREYGAQLMLNAPAELCAEVGADGVHLNVERLRKASKRPVARDLLLSASCHNAEEIDLAEHLGVDFLYISPVLATRSHPKAKPLGWAALARLAERAARPVYALGGLGVPELASALTAGCIGIAGIEKLWDSEVVLTKARLVESLVSDYAL